MLIWEPWSCSQLTFITQWTGHASHLCWAKLTNLTRAPHACFERWPSWVWNICAAFYLNGDGLIFSRTLRGFPSCPWGSQLLHRYTHQPHIRGVASVVRSMYWQFGHADRNRTSTIVTYSKYIPGDCFCWTCLDGLPLPTGFGALPVH